MADAATTEILDPLAFTYIVGIDIGSETCCFTVLPPQKQVVIKPTEMANAASGFTRLQEQMAHLGVAPEQAVVGLEATSRYGENLFHASRSSKDITCVYCIPDKPMSSPAQRGLRAKTDRLDAGTIARVLRARRGSDWLCARRAGRQLS